MARLATVLAVSCAFTCALCPGASARTITQDGRIAVESQAAPGGNSPNRCIAVAFVRWKDDDDADATGVTYTDSSIGQTVKVALKEPFSDDYRNGPVRFKAPKGEHQQALTSIDTTDGCDVARARFDNRFSKG